MPSPKEIVNTMMAADLYSQWLGISVLEVGEGSCKIQLTVRKEMVNGFGITHGGITYCLSDSALAFASNNHGPQAVSIETSISHTAKVLVGDILTADARELSRSKKIGFYEVTVKNQENKIVSLFKGTVYITKKNW
ncbi:MAG: hotdog fold thioesterase [Sphingobacteriaceae bacterium]|nr:hotdog fold thioesterase [Sphingobacteriaceae bacterium]